MAAIGKIRSWGPWLVGIIGLALFGFIATDFTRSCETSSNQARQKVGEVMGEKLSIQDYQTTVEEYKNLLKVTNQNIGEDELREFVWEQYVQNTIIAEEAEKLGLGVTDEELKTVLEQGTHPVLRNWFILPQFFNQQTGRFDYNNVAQIYNAFQQQQQNSEQFMEFDKYWRTVEKLLRQSLLAQKYQTLLQSCMLSNEASAKIAFDGSNNVSEIVLASLAYNSINEKDVTVSDQDLKAKYDEKKEMFKWNTETRDIKYVVCNVIPSAADSATLRNGLAEAAQKLEGDSVDVPAIVASHRSVVTYHENMPYNANGLKNFSSSFNLKAALDSMPEKHVTKQFTYVTMQGGKPVEYMAVARLNRRFEAVDSVSYKFIGVPGNDFDDATKRADSLIAKINGGISIDSVANDLGQKVQTAWISADLYQRQETIVPDMQTVMSAVREASLNTPKYVKLSNQVLLFVVTERKNPVKLYDVAIVSNELRFFNETEEATYNKFSQYVSECSNAADLEKNAAKYGYTVVEQKNLQSNAFNIGSPQPLENTREAVKWAFAKAQEGNISEIFRNSAEGRFLTVAVTGIHPVGYLDQKSVENELRAMVIKDKKADMLIKKLAGAKTIAAAQEKGAAVDTIRQITFPMPVNVHGQQELGLSGAVAVTAKGQTCNRIVKGTNGIFLFEVVGREPREGATFNRRNEERQLIRNMVQLLTPSQYNRYTSFFDVLKEKAKVEDNRYQF